MEGTTKTAIPGDVRCILVKPGVQCRILGNGVRTTLLMETILEWSDFYGMWVGAVRRIGSYFMQVAAFSWEVRGKIINEFTRPAIRFFDASYAYSPYLPEADSNGEGRVIG